MSRITDIRTIAKTDLLEEKVGRALSLAETANTNAKSALQGEKGVAVQNTTGSNPPAAASSGGALTGPVQLIPPSSNPNDLGNKVEGIASAAGVPNVSPFGNNNLSYYGDNTTTTGNLNPGGGSSTDSGSNTLGGAHAGGGIPGTDGGVGGGAIGGSNVGNVANYGANDSTLQSLNSTLSSQGYSDDDIARFDNGYIQATYGEPGVVTAKDIADARSWAPPLIPSSTGGPPGGYTGAGPFYQILNGTIGYDKDQTMSSKTGEVLAVKVILNGPFPTPTEQDAFADGQSNPWTDPNNAPAYKGFQLGFYWTGTSPEAMSQPTPQQCPDEGIAAVRAAFPAPYPTGFGDAHWDESSLTQTSSTTWTFVWYQGPGLVSPNTSTLTRSTCPGPAGMCPSTAPTYGAWPRTGTTIITKIAALFSGNSLDSELPLHYNVASSSVRIALGNGGSVVDDRFMDIGLGVNGGYLLTVVAADGTTPLFANYYNSQGGLVQPNLKSDDLPYYKAR